MIYFMRHNANSAKPLAMNPKPQPFFRFVSTAEDPTTVQVDIINGLSGYEFSRLRLTCALGSVVLWTNRTAVTQVVQPKDRVLRLAPGRNDAATVITRWSESGQVVGRLRSNRAASITFTISEETQLGTPQDFNPPPKRSRLHDRIALMPVAPRSAF